MAGTHDVELPPDELLRLLTLEQIDVDLYRARNPTHDEGLALYGGQVAAQALVAASDTVGEGRYVHSLHGYYLRSGQWSRPILLHVERDRDGGSSAARHVVARQNGEAIFTMSASFAVDRDSPADVIDGPQAGTYEPPTERSDLMRRSRPVLAATVDMVPIWEPGEEPVELSHHFWVRSRSALPDDRRIHEAALAYVSDLSTGWARWHVDHGFGGPSIDHAVWFHGPARLDDWVRVRLEPRVLRHGRALYGGSIYDPSGALVGSLIQEHVFRPVPGLPRRVGEGQAERP